jgi:hypothetical protein
LGDMQHQGPFEHELVEVNAFFKTASRSFREFIQTKTVGIFSELSSPASFGKIKIRSTNPNPELFSAVPVDH